MRIAFEWFSSVQHFYDSREDLFLIVQAQMCVLKGII